MRVKRAVTITGSRDVHADRVEARIRRDGGNPFRLNLDEFPGHFIFDWHGGGPQWSGEIRNLLTGDRIDLADIGAVWMRRKADFAFVSKDLAPQELAYAADETEHMLLGLLHSLDCYWMSHPVALRSAGWKVEQLQRAARMGFATAPSIVTNDPATARRFIATHRDVVFKPLSSPALSGDKVDPGDRSVMGLATTRIGCEDDALLDAVAELPCFFQRYVPKRYELRVTVIGDRVFSARIHSQEDARTATDWRDMSADIRFEVDDLPDAVGAMCRAFVGSYGLTFGAMDIIVTPDGEYVFLENNPAGQFLFVQDLVPELDMVGAVAACLSATARTRPVP